MPNHRLPALASHAKDVVCVCGAGAAGLAAALAAARAGAAVCLLEARAEIGGTVAHTLIHTLGGLFDSSGELVNDGLPAELVDRLCRADSSVRRRAMGNVWVLNVTPATYARVVRSWLDEQPNITVLCNTQLDRVTVRDGFVEQLAVRHTTGRLRWQPQAVVDATGTAELVRRVDPRLVLDDSGRAAGGLIFTLRDVVPGTLDFPAGVGIVRGLRRAALAGQLPAECDKAWLDQGVVPDEVYVKLFVPLSATQPAEVRRLEAEAQHTMTAVVQFLQRLPGFAAARIERVGVLGIRDGGRVRGECCLSADDLRSGRQFGDAACRGCWPIEYWDPVDGVSIEPLPGDGCYDIPLRALTPQGLHNVWTAGKCLSADRSAQASARVVGTCWAMGAAAGQAAALQGARCASCR